MRTIASSSANMHRVPGSLAFKTILVDSTCAAQPYELRCNAIVFPICRLHRFQDVSRQIALGAPVDWTDLALAGGYCDQAHLAHEFRDFSGISPTAYLASE